MGTAETWSILDDQILVTVLAVLGARIKQLHQRSKSKRGPLE